MKKFVQWTVGVLLGVIAAVFVLQIIASERVEVVELHTLDAEGETATTRLWIVDHDGRQYLRSGAGGSGWLDRAARNKGEALLTRGGETKAFRLEPHPDVVKQINQLMAEKYTWGDTLIGYLAGSREDALPVGLQEI